MKEEKEESIFDQIGDYSNLVECFRESSSISGHSFQTPKEDYCFGRRERGFRHPASPVGQFQHHVHSWRTPRVDCSVCHTPPDYCRPRIQHSYKIR